MSAAFVYLLLANVWLLFNFPQISVISKKRAPCSSPLHYFTPFSLFPGPGSVMVCPPWRCSDAPQRALTPAHECDSERGTDAAKKEVGGGERCRGLERFCACAAISLYLPPLPHSARLLYRASPQRVTALRSPL